MLHEAGFLSIKDYDDESKIYSLTIPNKEVVESFIKIAANYSSKTNNIDSWGIQ